MPLDLCEIDFCTEECLRSLSFLARGCLTFAKETGLNPQNSLRCRLICQLSSYLRGREIFSHWNQRGLVAGDPLRIEMEMAFAQDSNMGCIMWGPGKRPGPFNLLVRYLGKRPRPYFLSPAAAWESRTHLSLLKTWTLKLQPWRETVHQPQSSKFKNDSSQGKRKCPETIPRRPGYWET